MDAALSIVDALKAEGYRFVTVEELLQSGGIQPEDGRTICQKGRIFAEILDLSTVASVTVGSITLPLEAG